MKIITVINQKGGVGKTTTALNIGTGLTNKGYKTLLIDLDQQGNLTYALGASTESPNNAFSVLMDPATIAESIVRTNSGAYLLPSTPALATADIKLINKPGPDTRLKAALDMINSDYDFCIIDTPPALGFLTSNALQAAGFAIIPAQADIFSLAGIGQLFATAINDVREYKKAFGQELKVLGIVLTRHNTRSVLSREVADALKEVAEQFGTKLFHTYIRENISVKESQVAKLPIYEYAPKSNAAADYAELLEEIIKEVRRND